LNKKLNQSIWSTVIIYSGIVIGFINSIFLFPKFLSTEQIGLIRQIISAVFILIPITTFGSGTTYTKFYPSFQKNYKQKNEFLSFQLFTIIVSFCIIFLVINIFLNDIKNLFTEKSNLLFEYQNLFFSLLFVLSLSSLFESYLRARYNTVLSNYVNGVSNRFLTSITILLLSVNFIDFNILLNLQLFIYLIGLLILIFYSNYIDKIRINISFNNIKKSINKILNFSSFSSVGTFSNILVMNVDVLMVTSILGLSETGIYTTAFYIGMIIEIPRRAISQISIPFISENIIKKRFDKIEKNYKNVSLHQMIIGALFLLLIIINLDDIYSMIPNSENFISGKNVVLIIGISKLIQMSFSYNSELISLSKYYRFTVITVFILAFFTISLNIILIPELGMIGAAYSSLISILIFNIVKFIFIKKKMNLSPFSPKSVLILILSLGLFYISSFIPIAENNFLNIIIKSFIITFLYISLILIFNISEYINTEFSKILKKLNLIKNF
tara:strand:+ start:4495 stop:5988 length:1494 start_codon:yes stop_codon:yes gene_type:complete